MQVELTAPFQPLSINDEIYTEAHNAVQVTWSQLTVRASADNRKLLDNISGGIKPGQFMAIMGPSGAGKTTFLNVISGRSLGKGMDLHDGDIYYNRNSLAKGFDPMTVSAFVPQDDVLMETMTPRECFRFSARMNYPTWSSEQIQEKVEWVIRSLEIEHCADTRIGSNLARGISGGERKRTSIGFELVRDPSVLFLDEPTTGLDSFTAVKIIYLLQKQATQENLTVLATIHQPSSEIYAQFDRLLLLTEGRPAFQGPALDALPYFASKDLDCPENYNPADYFMTILSEKADQLRHHNPETEPIKLDPISGLSNEPKHTAPSRFHQFKLLYGRQLLDFGRNPKNLRMKIGRLVVICAMSCIAFYHFSTDMRSLRDRFGLLFLMTMTMTFTTMISNLVPFQLSKPVFLRELSTNMYRPTPYFFASMASVLPFDLLDGVVMSCVVYWVVGLNSHVVNFFRAMLLIVLITFAGGSFGMLLGVVAPTVEAGFAMLPAILLPNSMVAGLMVNLDTVPNWFVPKWTSTFRYGFEGLVQNEFDDLPDVDSRVSDHLIDLMNFKFEYWWDVLLLFVIGLAFRILALILINVKNRRKPNKFK